MNLSDLANLELDELRDILSEKFPRFAAEIETRDRNWLIGFADGSGEFTDRPAGFRPNSPAPATAARDTLEEEVERAAREYIAERAKQWQKGDPAYLAIEEGETEEEGAMRRSIESRESHWRNR
jgi:hypothetical protein